MTHKEHERLRYNSDPDYRERKKKRMRENYARKVRGSYTVLLDPDKEYGLAAGLKISTYALERGLVLGTYTPGTILVADAQRYQVVGEMDKRQRLVMV
jgi:hypothetical protein